jgi:hypothetical protein
MYKKMYVQPIESLKTEQERSNVLHSAHESCIDFIFYVTNIPNLLLLMFLIILIFSISKTIKKIS